jgi:hypothetical protein
VLKYGRFKVFSFVYYEEKFKGHFRVAKSSEVDNQISSSTSLVYADQVKLFTVLSTR